jgi:para-aminobenzoate synthetase
LKLLIIDNFDSFTNNIADFLRGLRNEITVDVVRNDDFAFLASARFLSYDAIVISPGPGNPRVQADLGISRDILATETRPVLGVCLGHQAMALAAGGQTELAPQPMHGRISRISHTGCGLFRGLPASLPVMRYHSWVVNRDLPETMIADAWTDDGIVMGIRCTDAPRWGVQFHPESIGTDAGRRILDNFLSLAEAHGKGSVARATDMPRTRPARALYWRRVGPALDPAGLVEAQGLVHNRRPMVLESSLVREGLSRFSIVEVPDSVDRSISYCVRTGMLSTFWGDRLVSREQKSIFTELEEHQSEVSFPDGTPPFAFHGGLVGWLGYELKSELLGVTSWPSRTADAAFRVVTRFLVVDHESDATFAAVCLPQEVPEAEAADVLSHLRGIAAAAAEPKADRRPHALLDQTLEFTMRHSPEDYLELIRACQREIEVGESYELCLTNTITAKLPLDSWSFFKLLRERNPSPYGAFLSIGDTEVIASSPERFLTVDGTGLMESKPIKGTTRRGTCHRTDRTLAEELQNSEKERAENIMIVDLVRHDFAHVAIPGSVDVAKLCGIESFQFVHQLVSTIRGRLRPGLTCIDAIRATFPGGSMTGAPKKRSVEILDRLELGPRGIYSGALGWIGFDGQADLSIVIRTVVKQGDEVTIGCGGAITYLADPQAELDEIMLKSQSLLRTLSEHLNGDPTRFRLSAGYVAAVA